MFDNLIHGGDMPVTAAVFMNPGVFADGRRNRSIEYDTLSDTYARFLLEEILPEVEKTVKLRKEPEARAIGGMSSGGICGLRGRARPLPQGAVVDGRLREHRRR